MATMNICRNCARGGGGHKPCHHRDLAERRGRCPYYEDRNKQPKKQETAEEREIRNYFRNWRAKS